MATEIERKFLVVGEGWRQGPGARFLQGYLNRDKHRTVRVRVAGNRAHLTIKGLTTGASRAEFEYAVPLADGEAMLTLCDGPIIEKVRYRTGYQGNSWEIDEFAGANSGLVVAEIELESENESFPKPPWLGPEVTSDPRYFNSNLATNPYSTW